MNSLTESKFNFPNQINFYKGKVRDVYFLKNNLVVMVASDRISAFDHVLPKGIPYKGQVLNQIASYFLESTKDIVPNWLLATPDPSVSIGLSCEPIRIEMVIRGYLAGHAAREYKAGKRVLCGVELPEGLRENDKLPNPIITPAVKAEEGHDVDISREEIIKQKHLDEHTYTQLENFTQKLFARGTEMAAKQGLILVDTKYEFGIFDGKIYLIDEIHTPDSSRYFYADGYQERQQKGEEQRQLSKEFVRQWLIENGFQGLEGQKIPEMNDEIVLLISKRYIELYEKITGKKFLPSDNKDIETRVFQNVCSYLNTL